MENPYEKSNDENRGAAVVLILLALISLNGKPAWARVVQAFNEAPDVHMVRTDILEQGIAVKRHEAWIKNQNLFRMESDDYCIIDDGKRVLTLYKDLKIAHLRDSFTPYWDYTPLILKVLRRADQRTGHGGGEARRANGNDRRLRHRFSRSVDRQNLGGPRHNRPVRIAGVHSRSAGQAKAFEATFDYSAIPDTLFTTSIPAGYRKMPNPMYENDEPPKEPAVALAGVVVDPLRNAVPDARVFASYAAPGRTDAQGAFALPAPPTDSSRSIGFVDLPMFVWAYPDGDPRSVAWTVIRPPLSREPNDSGLHIEETHQGVALTIVDENDFRLNLPGSPGRFGGDGDMQGNPQSPTSC